MEERVPARSARPRRGREGVTSNLASELDAERARMLQQEGQRIAYAYLLQKYHRGGLVPNLSSRSMKAIALHCCGAVFEPNGQGRYDRLEAFFEQSGWRQLSKEEAFIALRRLVFSLVNQYLFRQRLQEQPDLTAFCEQIKREAAAFPGLSAEDRGGEEWLVVRTLTVGRDALPIAPVEVLQVHCADALRRSGDLRWLLQALITFLEEHRYYAGAYPLAGLAWVLHLVSEDPGSELPRRSPPGS